MTIALLLYGSRARGDHRLNSDVDLLSIKVDGQIKYRPEVEKLTLHEYPFTYLESQALKGDLFLLHLVKEAKSLSDDLALLKRLQDAFTFCRTYEYAKNEAAAIYWFCKTNSSSSDRLALKKRLIWVIRTMIIADAAENRQAVFSSKALEVYSSFIGLGNLLDNRERVDVSDLMKVARQMTQKYYKIIKPKQDGYRRSVRWLSKKGSVAAATPAFLAKTGKPNSLKTFISRV